MINYHNGDIFEAPVSVIIHQANCFCTMGAGIAKRIKQLYPRAYQSDQMTKRGDPKKLGQFSFALSDSKQYRTIINLYGQYFYGRDKQYTDYKAVIRGLRNIHDFLIKMGMEKQVVGIPNGMGCRLSGGDWNVVEGIIKSVFEHSKIKILICNY